MKKILFFASALLVVSSCEIVIHPTELEHVKIGVAAMDMSDFPQTKADLEIIDNIARFSWEASDVVGMFPDRGAQAYFEMADHEGKEVAEFDGGGWALKGASKYSVYYPYSYDHRERTSIPLSYKGQIQREKNTYRHIKDFQHLATGAEIPQNGTCNYEMERAEAIVRFRLTLPRIAIYEEITIKIADGSSIVTSSRLDVSGDSYQISPDTAEDRFTVSLEEFSTSVENEEVDIYMMLPPQDLSTKKLIISVNTIEGDCCQAEVDGKNMLNNKAYQYSAILTTEFGSRGEDFEGIEGNWNKNKE